MAATAEREPMPSSMQDPAQGNCPDLPERAEGDTRLGSSTTLTPADEPAVGEKTLKAGDNDLSVTDDQVACPHLQAASSAELVEAAIAMSGEHSRQLVRTPSQCTDVKIIKAQDERVKDFEEMPDRDLLRSYTNDKRNQERDASSAQNAYGDTETSDSEGKSNYDDEYIDLHDSGSESLRSDTTNGSEFEDNRSGEIDKSTIYEASEQENLGCPTLFVNSDEAACLHRSLSPSTIHTLSDSVKRHTRFAPERQPIQGFVERVNTSSAKFRITFDINGLPSMLTSSQYATQLPSPQSDVSMNGGPRGKKRVRYTEEDDEALLRLRNRQGLSFDEIQRRFFPRRTTAALQVRHSQIKTKVPIIRKRRGRR